MNRKENISHRRKGKIDEFKNYLMVSVLCWLYGYGFAYEEHLTGNYF